MALAAGHGNNIIAIVGDDWSWQRSDDRHAGIEQDEQNDESAHESSEYDAYDGFPRCVAVILKVLH